MSCVLFIYHTFFILCEGTISPYVGSDAQGFLMRSITLLYKFWTFLVLFLKGLGIGMESLIKTTHEAITYVRSSWRNPCLP